MKFLIFQDFPKKLEHRNPSKSCLQRQRKKKKHCFKTVTFKQNNFEHIGSIFVTGLVFVGKLKNVQSRVPIMALNMYSQKVIKISVQRFSTVSWWQKQQNTDFLGKQIALNRQYESSIYLKTFFLALLSNLVFHKVVFVTIRKGR